MQAQELPSVKNPVHDYVRTRAVKALMDSISAPPPGAVNPAASTLVGSTVTVRRYSHILVKDQTLAAALRDSLMRGVPFADLARRHSTDNNAAAGISSVRISKRKSWLFTRCCFENG